MGDGRHGGALGLWDHGEDAKGQPASAQSMETVQWLCSGATGGDSGGGGGGGGCNSDGMARACNAGQKFPSRTPAVPSGEGPLLAYSPRCFDDGTGLTTRTPRAVAAAHNHRNNI